MLDVLPAVFVVEFWLAVMLSDAVVVIVASGATKPSDAVGVVPVAPVCPSKAAGYRAYSAPPNMAANAIAPTAKPSSSDTKVTRGSCKPDSN